VDIRSALSHIGAPSDTNLVLVLVGLPGAGKSSVAKGWGYPMVNRSAVRANLGAAAITEKLADVVEHVMVRSLFGAGHSIVVVDDHHLRRYQRKKWLSVDWHTVFIHFDTGAEECKSHRSRCPDVHPIIDKLQHNRDPVLVDEFALIPDVSYTYGTYVKEKDSIRFPVLDGR